MDMHVISANELQVNGKIYACAIGKGGFIHASEKREGDGKTPLGSYHLRECWYRPDKLDKPITALHARAIAPNDGWCDAPDHARYNQHVSLPFDASHERLWLDADDVYDLIIPLGYNDAPVMAGKGSAIFLHVAKPDYSPTEGCVAIAKSDLWALIPELSPQSSIIISPADR